MVGVCYDGVEGVLYLCLFSILAACAFTVMLCAIPRAWRQIACRSVHFQACLPAWAPSFSHSAPFSMYIPVYRLSQHIPKNTVIWSFVSIRRHSHRTQEMQYRKPFLWCSFPNFSLKGTRLRWHGWGGPVQPTGKEIRVSEPWPHQHAQLLQLQQQHGQPDQPAPARPGCLQCPNVWVHVSQKKNNLGGGGKWHQKFEPYPSHLSHFFLQEPHSSFRGKSTVWECASDRTRLSTPIGALGPRGQVLPMMSFLSQLNSGSGFLRNNSLLFLSFFLTWWLS